MHRAIQVAPPGFGVFCEVSSRTSIMGVSGCVKWLRIATRAAEESRSRGAIRLSACSAPRSFTSSSTMPIRPSDRQRDVGVLGRGPTSAKILGKLSFPGQATALWVRAVVDEFCDLFRNRAVKPLVRMIPDSAHAGRWFCYSAPLYQFSIDPFAKTSASRPPSLRPLSRSEVRVRCPLAPSARKKCRNQSSGGRSRRGGSSAARAERTIGTTNIN